MACFNERSYCKIKVFQLELLHLVSLLLFHSLTLLVVEAKYEESIKYFDEFEYCLIVITWYVSSNWPEKYPMSVCQYPE